MAKLIDRLKDTATGGRTIGCAPGKRPTVPRWLVLAEVAADAASLAEAAVEGGAHALVVRVPRGRGALREVRKAVEAALELAGDLPRGVALEAPSGLDRAD